MASAPSSFFKYIFSHHAKDIDVVLLINCLAWRHVLMSEKSSKLRNTLNMAWRYPDFGEPSLAVNKKPPLGGLGFYFRIITKDP